MISVICGAREMIRFPDAVFLSFESEQPSKAIIVKNNVMTEIQTVFTQSSLAGQSGQIIYK